MMKSILMSAFVATVFVLGFAAPAAARGLMDTIDLPDGFNPEGVANAPGKTLVVGSIASGAVYQFSPYSGEGSLLVPPREGRSAVGMKWDRRSDNLYVAGGPTGKIYVYDVNDGSDVAEFSVNALGATLVNDVVVTRKAAYFTDSWRPVIYRLPLGCGGSLAADAELEEIPLSGDYNFDPEPETINFNGIVSPSFNGDVLLIVNSAFGELYKVDPMTGDSEMVDLGDNGLQFGDGMLLVGCKLYVVQNFLNQIAVVSLDDDYLSGAVTDVLTNDGLDMPATIARVGHSLYAVNARFNVPPLPDTTYTVVRVPLF